MEFEAIYNRHNRSNPAFSSPSSTAPTHLSLGPLTGPNSIIARQTSAPLTSPMESTEEVDSSSRPRLTQEQITTLEQEFGQLQKPSTDFKKQLADRIGLTLARVNNWYQNRRAKTKNGAKNTEAQFEVRTDDLQLIWPTIDQSFQNLPTYFNMGNPPIQPHRVVNASPTADHAHGHTSYFGGSNFDFQFEIPEFIAPEGQDPMPMAFSEIDFNNDLYSPEVTIPSPDCKMPTAETVDFGLEAYSPDTPVGFAIPQDLPAEQTTQTMYHMVDSGFLVGNLSDQTFISATSSSDGEQPRMMTPPEKPSPISLRPQDAFDRRPSITGALVNDFQNGCHLQRQGSNQNPYEDTLDAPKTRSMSSAQDSATASARWDEGHVTPTLDLDTFTEPELAATQGGLAARRKRPRPAPLIKPDAQRSYSYNGPLTSSPPSARKSLLNPSQPVRRIRSNIDVFNGRVQKPRSSSAQHSPRSLESRVQNAFNADKSSRSTSTTFQSPPTPLSSVHGKDVSLEYPSHFTDHSNQVFGTPTTFDGSMNPNSPPATPYDVSPFSTERSQGLFIGHAFETHQPAQSAPPQKTNFFLGDSPPVQNSTIGHLSWQAPHEVPSNHFSEQNPAHVLQTQFQATPGHYEPAHLPSTYAPQQAYPSPPQHQVPSQGQTAFSPPQFHPSPEHLYQNSHQFPYPRYQSSPMALYQQNVYEMQAQPQQLEIKVELGPQPKGPPQPRKQYTFSNTTPDDFCSPKDE